MSRLKPTKAYHGPRPPDQGSAMLGADEHGGAPHPVLRLGRDSWPGGLGARVALWALESRAHGAARGSWARMRGQRLTAELFLAFDDPYAPLAVDATDELLAERHIDWTIRPVVRRGLPSDPHAALRRRYAVLDARRMSNHGARPIVRTEVQDPQVCAPLALWTEAARDAGCAIELCRAMLDRLWRHGSGFPDFGELYAMYTRLVGSPPPRQSIIHGQRVRKNETHLRRRGHWDSSALWLAGKWFVPHERAHHIATYLEEIT